MLVSVVSVAIVSLATVSLVTVVVAMVLMIRPCPLYRPQGYGGMSHPGGRGRTRGKPRQHVWVWPVGKWEAPIKWVVGGNGMSNHVR